jgi:hypothetical protein
LGRGVDGVKGICMDKSQMRVRPGFLLGLFTVFVVIPLLVSFLLQPSSGKLRGNKYAMFMCRTEIRIWKNEETNGVRFDFNKLSDENKWHAIALVDYQSDFWIKTDFDWENASNREIVIVCKKEFDNVPEPALWNFFRRNPAHAAGYSDGTADLISPEQFTNLNLSGFVSLQSLATNSEFGVIK